MSHQRRKDHMSQQRRKDHMSQQRHKDHMSLAGQSIPPSIQITKKNPMKVAQNRMKVAQDRLSHVTMFQSLLRSCSRF